MPRKPGPEIWPHVKVIRDLPFTAPSRKVPCEDPNLETHYWLDGYYQIWDKQRQCYLPKDKEGVRTHIDGGEPETKTTETTETK